MSAMEQSEDSHLTSEPPSPPGAYSVAQNSPPTSPNVLNKSLSPPTSPTYPSSSLSTLSPGSPAHKRQRRDETVSRSTLLRRLHDEFSDEDDIEIFDQHGTNSDSGEQLFEGGASNEDGAQPSANLPIASYDNDMLPTVSSISCDSDSSSIEDTFSDSSNSIENNSDQENASEKSGTSYDFSMSADSNSDGDASSRSDINSSDSDDDLLYTGSNIKTNEAILKILKVYISQRKTKNCLNADVKLFKSLLPRPNSLPSSGKSLLTKLKELSPFLKDVCHFYCSECQESKVLESDVCICNNSTKTGVFYEFPIESQVRYLFEERDLASVIDTNNISKEGFISDIRDGSEYHRVRSHLESQYDLVFVMNTDGVKLASSSKIELWGVLLVICEVPPRRRSSFIVVGGVFVDYKKPNMNLFLKPFVNSMKTLYQNGGVKWTHPASAISMTSQVVCPVLCADAPAKALVLNVKSFAHRYGCNICEQKAVKVTINIEDVAAQPTKKQTTLRRFVFQDEPGTLRVGFRMKLQGELAERRKKSRKGVIGEAVICTLPFFDRGLSVCAEYMHTVLLGVVKYFLDIMTTVRGPWYIGKHVDYINHFLLSIKVPDFVKRLPRALSDVKYWKASELRSFLLYYSLPVLKDCLPHDYFQHWMLLVAAIFILLKENISVNDLNAADIMLRCFVRDIHTLYHDRYFTYNVHNLLHLSLLVKRWGPLWATSAFDFETYNGYIKSHVHGTKHLGKEFLGNIKIIQSVLALERSLNLQKIVEPTEGAHTIDIEIRSEELSIELLPAESLAISNANITDFKLFGRVKFNSIIYTSKYYDNSKKRANSLVQFQVFGLGAYRYGEILYFLKQTDGQVLCLINSYSVKHMDLFFLEESFYQIRHLLPVEDSGDLIVLPVTSLVTKIIKAGKYLCLRPNPFEVNL